MGEVGRGGGKKQQTDGTQSSIGKVRLEGGGSANQTFFVTRH